MSASSSSGGITRIVSPQGAGSAPASLVQSSIRSSCMILGALLAACLSRKYQIHIIICDEYLIYIYLMIWLNLPAYSALKALPHVSLPTSGMYTTDQAKQCKVCWKHSVCEWMASDERLMTGSTFQGDGLREERPASRSWFGGVWSRS